MNSPEIKAFIRKHSSLFWYIPEDKKEEISEDILVEFILNYGTLEDVKELFRIMGIKETARVFYQAEGRKKLNYYPEVYNFFDLYFKKYA
jgi:negative regulator of genetic competence, sporulation and motility